MGLDTKRILRETGTRGQTKMTKTGVMSNLEKEEEGPSVGNKKREE